MRFRRQKTDKVGSYRVFEVLRHELLDVEAGATREVFTFACRDWVSVVPVTRDGKFVLVRQYRIGVDGPTLEIPGGVIDEGQEPAGAALRELREETGYGGGELVSLGATQPNPALQNNWHHMFLARGVERMGEPQFDAGEHCELVVVSESEMRTLMNDGSITHALALVALVRAFEKLDRSPLDEVLVLLSRMEELQARKVIELAQRLVPGLTAEDIKNPHDFPDLDDTDWHFEDGQLAGIQSVAAAVRALRNPPSR
jgi:8-oxo-dGTP pyrophosphatase MutT (NUDIX family)